MSKAIKTYNQLPPNVKQAINNTAAKAARAVVGQVKQQVTQKQASRRRGRTTRTRNGMRIYAPSDVVETRSVAPVSYATTWTSGAKSLRVRQTEVVGRVSANNTFFPIFHNDYSVAAFPINPANPKTFPWLSYIARLYDKYRFYSLRFIYVNSVNTLTEGNVVMSLDYDTLDAPPQGVVEASQLARYKLGPLYCPASLDIPVSHPGNNPWLYTFDLSATSGSVDLKTYNLGNFFLALDGVPQDGKDYGYLAVEYDVELLDKNPVTTTEVFASQTYDASAPVTKKSRSNVDPADTMEVGMTWGMPSVSEVTTNSLGITFSDNVKVGAKVRLAVLLTSLIDVQGDEFEPVEPWLSISSSDEGVTVLDAVPSRYAVNSSVYLELNLWCNLDIVVPESRSVSCTVTANNCRFIKSEPDTGQFSSYCTGFTYA